MLPITGPFNFTSFYYGRGGVVTAGKKAEMKRTWYAQKKPYDLPLTFTSWKCIGELQPNIWYTESTASWTASVTICVRKASAETEAYNKAYKRFVGLVTGEKSLLSVTIAERKQAVEMIASRLTGIRRFSQDLKKLNFISAARRLGLRLEPLPPPPGAPKSKRYRYYRDIRSRKVVTLRTRSRDFGNNFLEFHFGWEPLVKDTYNAIRIVCGDDVSLSLPLISRATVSFKDPAPGLTLGSLGYQAIGSASALIRAQVRLDNPSGRLFDRLGLTNPAVVLWELIPFSFVVDWFVNVNDVLSSFTDFQGVTLVNPSTTNHVRGVNVKWYRASWTGVDKIMPIQNYYGHYTTRTLSISGPSLKVTLPDRLSVLRGLTAASLLTQTLKGH